ncbi:MAG: GAF domain-containing sensor histidine kinase [Chloroflexi bacterium]|nr:GAF domain-containing sensor histidine kinase [Chloroflexota bacterium]
MRARLGTLGQHYRGLLGRVALTLRSLRFLAFAVPLVFLTVVDLLRHLVWAEQLHTYPGFLVVPLVVAGGTYLLVSALFEHIRAVERRLLAQNRELRAVGETARHQTAQLAALHEAGLAISSELGLEMVLQRVVELARELAGAQYGALSIVDAQGGIVRFLTTGLTTEQRSALGNPPVGRGLLGVVVGASRPLRVDRIGGDPRSCGFPPGHPPMTTLLGVPIATRGRTFGNLYLTDKRGPDGVASFTPADEELLRLFAAQAAVAMENARLHAEVKGLAAAVERERIARELHDSLAQALGYVRLRAATARDSLQRGNLQPSVEALEQIGRVAGEAYADVREAILGLRSKVGGERGLSAALAEYFEHYRFQTGVETRLEMEPSVEAARAAPGAEAQLLRIIQEALANVRKHAAARQVVVRLLVVDDLAGPRLRALVTDDGRGFDPIALPKEAHYGLVTMSERAESVGGSVEIVSAPGSGTRVEIEVPLETAPATHAVAHACELVPGAHAVGLTGREGEG